MNTRLLRLLRARRGLLKLLRERPISGTALSVLVHVAVIALVVWFGLPMSQPPARRGEALFVELPQLPEPAPRGNPALRERGPEGPAEPPPPRAEAPKPVPPAPARRAEPPAPRPAPSRPAAPPAPAPPPSPPRVASAPAAPAPPPPVAKPAEPAPPEPSAAPAPPPAAPAPPQEARVAPAPAPPQPPSPAPAGPGIAWPPKPELPGSRGGPAVAAIPGGGSPGREPGAPDVRSALRRGGGGGPRDGRGGIEGEPIPLDSKDPKYSDYLDRVRELIKAKWIYPCVPDPTSRTCEYKSAALEIEFGIAKDGRVPFVIVRQGSQFSIYDEYAVNAIKLASPFPPVPDDLSKKGIPILARFNYVLERTSLTNLLR